MVQITRRAFGALSFAGLAAQARAKAPAPAARPAWPDATETAALIRSGQQSAAEAARTAITRAERLQPKLNFLVASDFDRALGRATAGGQSGPFAGVPFLIKHLDDFAGPPPRHAPLAARDPPGRAD